MNVPTSSQTIYKFSYLNSRQYLTLGQYLTLTMFRLPTVNVYDYLDKRPSDVSFSFPLKQTGNFVVRQLRVKRFSSFLLSEIIDHLQSTGRA